MKLFLPDMKYERQMVALAAAILGILAAVNFWKMFRGGLLRTVMSPVGRAVKRVASAFSKRMNRVLERVRKALGLPDPRTRARGTDERSFLFRTRREGKGQIAEKLQWKELKDNRERLRFLYVRFVKRQAKKGYRYSPSRTPIENGAEWRLSEEDGNAFFGAYTDARFAGDGERVTREELERFADLTGKKLKNSTRL